MMPKAVLALQSIDVTEHKIAFNYLAQGHEITRAILFPDTVDLTSYDDDTFATLVKYCALGDCVYMFNFDYFDQIDVPFELTMSEKKFFENAYYNGLAEFRYVNDIELTRSVTLNAPIGQIKRHGGSRADSSIQKRAFVLNGGGKDGAVAMEIAKRLNLDVAWFSSGMTSSRSGVVTASGVTDGFIVERRPDPNAILEKKYSGHKPMSLYVAMVASLCAFINKRYYVVAANEYSASFPNLTVDGMAINHQYTKSLEFEENLERLFASENIPVRYFSIVRPLYEIQIVKLFSSFDQYHVAFVSCNRGRYESWCLDCAKCAFVVGAMYALAPQKAAAKWGDMEGVYGKHPNLIDETIELINPDQKPFECIGTTEENMYLLNKLIPLLTLTSAQYQRYSSYVQRIDSNIELDLSTAAGVDNFPLTLRKDIYRTIEEVL